MAFPREFISYGVIKLSGTYYKWVDVYKSQNDYRSLQGFSGSRGMSAVDARWSGDAILVTMDDGSVRRYSDFGNYTRV